MHRDYSDKVPALCIRTTFRTTAAFAKQHRINSTVGEINIQIEHVQTYSVRDRHERYAKLPSRTTPKKTHTKM